MRHTGSNAISQKPLHLRLGLTEQCLEGVKFAVSLALSLHHRPIPLLRLLELEHDLVTLFLRLGHALRLGLELIGERLYLYCERV
jgi:hypothetical protein